MGVDEAGHQRAPAAIDHLRAAAADRRVGELAHAIVFHEQLVAAAQLAVGGLEQLEVLEVKLCHLPVP